MIGFEILDCEIVIRFPSGDSGPIVVTEIMPNGTLAAVMKSEFRHRAPSGWTPTKKSIAIFGICAGMAYVHSCQITHRDLKLENVFLDGAFEPVIADFGFSRHWPGAIALSANIGTPLAMAPELLAGSRAYDATVDVFAFAVALFELFAPRTTLLDDGDGECYSQADLQRRVGAGARLQRPDGQRIPDYFWGVICRCWAHTPADRPSFHDLVEEFRTTHAYVLPGAEMDDVFEYEERIRRPLPGTEIDPIVLAVAKGTASQEDLLALSHTLGMGGRPVGRSSSPVDFDFG
jgi:serine/threonine protein kinase